MGKKKQKILVVCSDSEFRDFIAGELSEEFSLHMAVDENEGLSLVETEKPDLILIDREIPRCEGEDFCQTLKKKRSTASIPVIMIASPEEDGKIVLPIYACADDYLAKPVFVPELQAKIRSHLHSKKLFRRFKKMDLIDIIEVYETVTTFHTSHEILLTITRKIAKETGAVKCSVVKVDDNTGEACVVASNEDDKVENLKIDIDKYPEIKKAFELKHQVYIKDLKKDPLTADFREGIKGLPFSSVAIVPIALKDKMIGTLFLRVAAKKGKLSERDLAMCSVTAKAAYRVLENAKLVESLRFANIKLEKLATTDGLTGIYNHRYFYQRLEEEFNISTRYNLSLACIMLDIDFFKRINDTYGHRKGDQILKEMAAIISRTIRKTDVEARYGGEEFVILLPHTNEKGAMFQAERIRSAVGKGRYSVLPNGETVTISLGVATCKQDAVRKAEDLVKFADKALYEAKGRGRNQSVMWGDF
ncbi:MAG: diguanylate cyclase [Proteobacteria bacterium]|nr:diguanylate cyclase [Pseudomonadota bacterium]